MHLRLRKSKVGFSGTFVNSATASNEINLFLPGVIFFSDSINSLLLRRWASENVPNKGDNFLAKYFESLYEGALVVCGVNRGTIYDVIKEQTKNLPFFLFFDFRLNFRFPVGLELDLLP